MGTKDIRYKIRRIASGKAPRVLDLFAGCGGLSLGFHREGFEIAAAVENDPLAAQTHAFNLFRDQSARVRLAHAQALDITKIDPCKMLAEHRYTTSCERVIDVVVGGPPCQAFARVGRAKLREVAEHPEAFKLDPRGNLYLRFLHFIKKLQPLAILMENVPDVINYGGHNIPEETCEVLDAMGYVSNYTLLNSAFFGVPQMRERMFLLAYRKELQCGVTFPEPTHYIALPKGYFSSRQVALRHVELGLFATDTAFVAPPEPSPTLQPAITAAEALSDLPEFTDHLTGNLKRGARRFDQIRAYRTKACRGTYPNLMRTWKGFESTDGISDHVIRYLPRDYAIFKRMNPGDEYPEAYSEALKMLDEALADYDKVPARDSAEYRKRRSEIVPPYDPSKFPNKWRKMEPDKPARTLMAHLGKDGYSHIHYDSAQSRTISVREAARLQSFPDGFKFCGTMNPAFRQIGNAVPPLLAAAIAHKICRALKESSWKQNSQLNGSPHQT